MNRTCLVSVATYGYLPRAFVMAQTFAAQHPDCDIVLLAPDMSQAQIDAAHWPAGPAIRMFGLDALAYPPVRAMHDYFDALELCCAIKPFLMHHALFKEGYDRVLMIDPDVMCHAPFDEVLSLLESTDVVVTPHVNSPLPEDGEAPNDMEFVTAGFINAGFLAARKSREAEVCLDWLMRKVVDCGFFAPQYNLYADQTWVSCLPWFFPANVSVFRHPGMNVAYWNLHERRLSREGASYFCNGQRLIFFHYSGFDPQQPTQLTKHSRRTLHPDTGATLAGMLGDYTARLKRMTEEMPQLAPDSPCSRQPLTERLQTFRLVRGKAPEFIKAEPPTANGFAGLARSIIRKCRKTVGA